MIPTAASPNTTNNEFNSMPDIYRPAWAMPTSLVVAVVSGVALCAAAMFSCLIALVGIFALVFSIIDGFDLETIVFVLATLSPLFGFFLYPPGHHRKIIVTILIILTAALLLIGLSLEMGEFIGYAIIGTFLLHGSALSGIGLGKYAESIASPNRWREIHFKNNQCPRCLYDIRNLPEPRCPECGDTFDAEMLP